MIIVAHIFTMQKIAKRDIDSILIHTKVTLPKLILQVKIVDLSLRVKMLLTTNLISPEEMSIGVRKISRYKKKKYEPRTNNGKGQIIQMVGNDRDHIRNNEKNTNLIKTDLKNKSKSKKIKLERLKPGINSKIRSHAEKNFEGKQFFEKTKVRKINNNGKYI